MQTLAELVEQLRSPDQQQFGRVEEATFGVPNLDRLMCLDQHALAMYGWNHLVVPGLLQTPAYSKDVIRALDPSLTDREVRQRLLMRSARHEAFVARMERAQLPQRAVFFVGEHALGHALRFDARRLQLRHLLHLADLPCVVIQALPARVTPPGLASHLAMWTMDEPMDTGPCPFRRVAYTETALGGWYSTRPDDLERAWRIFSSLARSAASPYRTRQMIKGLI